MNFWQRLFGRKKTAPPDRAKTAPLDPGTLPSSPTPEGRQHILIGSAQSVGMERTHNEDALLQLFYSITFKQRRNLKKSVIFLRTNGQQLNVCVI